MTTASVLSQDIVSPDDVETVIYLEAGTYEVGYPMYVSESMMIQGAGAGQTILDAAGQSHFFENDIYNADGSPAYFILEGITFINGSTLPFFGNAVIFSSSFFLDNIYFFILRDSEVLNSTSTSAVIYGDYSKGEVHIENSVISGNHGDWGLIQSYGYTMDYRTLPYNEVHLTNSVFSNNTTGDSSSLINLVGERNILVINNSAFIDNNTGLSEPVIASSAAHANTQIHNSTFSGNGGMPSILEITGAANTLDVRNVTMLNNNPAAGSAWELNPSATSGSMGISTIQVSLYNSILDSSNGSLFCDDHNKGSWSGSNNILNNIGCATAPGEWRDINPQLGTLTDNGGNTLTHTLLAGSPAIDNGTCEFDTDQRGYSRPAGTTCDIGAFETGGQQGVTVPRVQRVTARSATNSKALTSTDFIPYSSDRLQVQFTDIMYNPASNSNTNDIDNPANYLVVATGSNESVDSVDCAAALGDDTVVSPTFLTYSPVSHETLLSFSPPLDEGHYGLLVCDNVRNTAGTLLDGNRDNVAGSDFVYPFVIGIAPQVIETQLDYAELYVVFNEAMANPTGSSQTYNVSNPANYRLLENGANNSFDTTTCPTVNSDDTVIPINSVSYDAATKTTTLDINNGSALPVGSYLLLACHQLQDEHDNELDGNRDGLAGYDYAFYFTVYPTNPNLLIVNTTDATNNGTCSQNHCSLAEAIERSNTMAGQQTIAFNILGYAPYTIRVGTQLPIITDSVILDGATQPGYVDAPLIVLDGDLLTTTGNGLQLQNLSNSVVRGFVVQNFPEIGIRLDNVENVSIEGNFLGTDVSGTFAHENFYGIKLLNSANVTIGGTTVQTRNVIWQSSRNRDRPPER
jgi:hypothetical protein